MVYRSSQLSPSPSSSDSEFEYDDFSEAEGSPATTYTDLDTPPRSPSPSGKFAPVDMKSYLPPSLAPSTARKLDARRSDYPDEYPPLPKLHANTNFSALDKGSADSWVPRDDRMVRLTGKVRQTFLIVFSLD